MVATPHATTVHVLGDEDSAKRRQILAGASKVFMDLGFDGASMGEIARAAGVSKGTLYVYFADKSRLFEAIVEQEMNDQQKIAFNFAPERDVPTTLREFGQAYIELLCRPGGGSAIRTVMAIAERMPEVGRRYYENVLEKTINRLADYLEVHVQAGELAIPDRHLAASQFMQMCQASLFLRFIFQAAPPPSSERIAEVVESADADVSGGVSRQGGLRRGPANFGPIHRKRNLNVSARLVSTLPLRDARATSTPRKKLATDRAAALSQHYFLSEMPLLLSAGGDGWPAFDHARICPI